MRLRPIEDGLIRERNEVGVTATQRDSLATELAKHSTDAIKPGVWFVAQSDGIAYEYKLDRSGNEISRRAARTLDMGDDRLPTLARVPKTESSPAAKNERAAARRVSGKSPTSVKTSTPRDTSAVDAVIRRTGYTGPINTAMRRAARDQMSHQNSLSAYLRGAK